MFIRGRWVYSASLGSFGCALVFIGFIRCLWVHSGGSLEVVGRVRPGGRWVHLALLGSLGVVGFIWMRPGDRWVHWRWFGSLGVVGFILVLPGVCLVYSGYFGSFGCALVVVGFSRHR